MTPDRARLLRLMLNDARCRGLLSSPPYSESGARLTWEQGYECAVRDIATGALPLPPAPRVTPPDRYSR